MLQNYNKYRVLDAFFRRPMTPLQLRQVCRQASLSPPSVKHYLRELIHEGLVLRTRGTIYKAYLANREREEFRNVRRFTLSIELQPLITRLAKESLPDAIILFGSASQGMDVEESEIDLAVLAEEVAVEIRPFERRLSRKISVHYYPFFGNLSEELKNSILNGIVLYGYVEAYQGREKPFQGKRAPPAGRRETGPHQRDG